MSIPKAYFIDIDGTLTGSLNKKDIGMDDLHAIKNAAKRGAYIVLTTGRSIEDAEPVWKQIYDGTKYTSYVIANNGAYIINKKINKIIFEDWIDENEFDKISEYAEKNNYALKTSATRKFYSKNKFIAMGIKFFKKDEVDNDFSNLIYDKNTSKKLGMVTSYSKSKVKKIQRELIEKYGDKLEIVVSGPGLFLEINKKGVDKGAAEKKLADIFEIDLKDAVHIGDSMNDFAGFKACGRSVAMKNGMKQLKKEATFVTGKCGKSGVANAINSLSIKK